VRDQPHVVLCESEAALARILTGFLGSEGFDLTPCLSLAEIETAVEQDPVAVVVTDSWLDGPPGLLGTDTAGLQHLAARTTVVLTTAWTGESHLAALAALGLGDALRVVPKPYDLDDLLSAVRSAVTAHQLRAGGGGRPAIVARLSDCR
jgi:DNA-binding NtrC family response regulator